MKALFVSLLLVCACCGTENSRAEPYVPTRNVDKFSVEIIFLSDQDVIKQCQQLGAWAGQYVTGKQGCSLFFPDRKPVPHCAIIIPKPAYMNDLVTLIAGHELLHCAHGKYHAE